MCEVSGWDVRMLHSVPYSTISAAIVHTVFCLEFVEDRSRSRTGWGYFRIRVQTTRSRLAAGCFLGSRCRVIGYGRLVSRHLFRFLVELKFGP